MERKNPYPVAVVLLPIIHEHDMDGLLVVRRSIPPQVGKLAFPGGYIDKNESWQEGAARELKEEAGIIINPNSLLPLWFTSFENLVLLFGEGGQPMHYKELPVFVPNSEVSERGIIFGKLEMDLAFPLHEAAAQMYFDVRRNPASARFIPL
jgi:8-oxo-dGTP pyrophosphatase MutT (NUDIX family)